MKRFFSLLLILLVNNSFIISQNYYKTSFEETLDSLIKINQYDECYQHIQKNQNNELKLFYLQYLYLSQWFSSESDNDIIINESLIERALSNEWEEISLYIKMDTKLLLAEYYSNNQVLNRAISYTEEALTDYIKLFGEYLIDFFYAKLALYSYDNGDYSRFLIYAEKVYTYILEKDYLSDLECDVLHCLGDYYHLNYNYEKSILCYKMILDKCLADIQYDSSFINVELCRNYAFLNDINNYKHYRKEILKSFHKHSNNKKLIILESFYITDFSIFKNKRLSNETINLTAKTFTKESIEYAKCLYLYFAFWNLNNYSENMLDITILHETYKTLSNIPMNNESIELLLRISWLYFRYNEFVYGKRILDEIEAKIGTESNLFEVPIEAKMGTESNLLEMLIYAKMEYYTQIGNTTKAFEENTKLLRIKKENNDGSGLLRVLNHRGRLYIEQNQYEKAIECDLYILNKEKELYGEELKGSSLYCLHNLFCDYASADKIDDAINIGEWCVKLRKERNDFYNYAISLNGLGYCYYLKGDIHKAIDLSLKADSILKNDHEMHYATNTYLETYYMENQDTTKLYQLLIEQKEYIDSFINKKLYTLSEEELYWYWNINNKLYGKIPQYAGLFYNNQKISMLAYNTLLTTKGKILNIINNKNNSFVLEKVNFNDIYNNISENAMFIEFAEGYETNHYVALIGDKKNKYPKTININIEKTENDSLYKNIWEPLLKHLDFNSNIYFSAAGKLHQIPLESLPIGDGKIMSDAYNMYRLSSTRELALKKEPAKYKKAVLYGGLNYDMTNEVMLTENAKYQTDSTYTLFASRGLLEDSIRGYKWTNLNNTKMEVEYISEQMQQNGISTKVFQGNEGSEESFKALSGKGYNIIHIATHGFFFPEPEAKRKDYFQPIMLSDDLGRNYAPADLSLFRTGLVLSGGNRAWQGDSIPDHVEDGILTAHEIKDLDLRGADLVVLSACNTGQGEITSEGVFGLQRAFKMAGAQTIIMSLTEVDDQTTMAMMNKLYSNLMEGQSKHDAFYNAQRYIRSIKPDPKYWRGWIMLD